MRCPYRTPGPSVGGTRASYQCQCHHGHAGDHILDVDGRTVERAAVRGRPPLPTRREIVRCTVPPEVARAMDAEGKRGEVAARVLTAWANARKL